MRKLKLMWGWSGGLVPVSFKSKDSRPPCTSQAYNLAVKVSQTYPATISLYTTVELGPKSKGSNVPRRELTGIARAGTRGIGRLYRTALLAQSGQVSHNEIGASRGGNIKCTLTPFSFPFTHYGLNSKANKASRQPGSQPYSHICTLINMSLPH